MDKNRISILAAKVLLFFDICKKNRTGERFLRSEEVKERGLVWKLFRSLLVDEFMG